MKIKKIHNYIDFDGKYNDIRIQNCRNNIVNNNN